jgi:hypothetical protein
MMEIGLAAGLGWFAIVFVIHLIVLWTTVPSVRPRISQMVFLFGIIGVLSSVVLVFSYLGTSASNEALMFSALGGILVYGGMLTLYLPFYYSIVASLSLQTIILLNEQANATLPIIRLRQRFSSRHFVAQRLETMTRNGFLVERKDGYCLTTKGRRVATTFLFFKRLWRLGAGG